MENRIYRVQYLSNHDGKWEDVSSGHSTYAEARKELIEESVDAQYSHRIIKLVPEVLAIIEKDPNHAE